MQNRYIGDLGDFGKYGLLKMLCQPQETHDRQALTLGVVWYLVPDEAHNSDGKHISYLEPSARNEHHYRQCDPSLYDTLRGIVRTDSRRVESVRRQLVLPSTTVYYEAPLTFAEIGGVAALSRREARLDRRRRWVQGALELTAQCDIVFVDPDNGLEVEIRPYQRHGPKYVFFDELLPYAERGQTLVIYHHMGRQKSATDQVQDRLAQIGQRLHREVQALLYHRGSARAFFIVPSQLHQELLLTRTRRFLDSPWCRHFELVSSRA